MTSILSSSDHNLWPAFTIPGDDGTPGATDFSFLLEKPAGSRGMVCIVDGHLATGDGQRLRLWGFNITARACLPSTEFAPQLARHLAKFGVNCVRLHFMDLRWPHGLIRRSQSNAARQAEDILAGEQGEDTRALDPEALARLDYFVACCKENGVYVDINLNVARQFTEADGLPQAGWTGFAKALTYFVPRMIELQKEYAAQLLGHVNPFTGTRYADEPAVALVELVNENSLLESWLSGRLRGEQTRPGSTWCDIPPVYAAELTRLWNTWLLNKYATRVALLAAWSGELRDDEDPQQGTVRRLNKEEFPLYATPRFSDEATFYAEVEQAWFADMMAYLKNEVGVRQIILGSSDHNQGLNNALHLRNLARLGITDGHYYWQHPEFPADKGWSMKTWSIRNTPMVDDPDRSVVARTSRSKVQGLPYLVSETNAPFPSDFAAGFMPILAAYASFQDWDGIFLYTYSESMGVVPGDGHSSQAITTFFHLGTDPVKMSESAAAALAFLRGDVLPARQVVLRELTPRMLMQSQLQPLREAPYLAPHLPGRLALTHGVAIARFDAQEGAPLPGEVELAEEDILSDTGELRWQNQPQDGRVFIDTPRWQAVIGRAGEMSTTNLALHLLTPYAAVQAISLDGQALAQAGQILLVTTARVANSGMQWQDETRQSLGDQFGQAPTRVEAVCGSLLLRGLEGARQVSVQSLDGAGQAVGEAMTAEKVEAGWKMELEPAGVWRLVKVER